MTRARRWWGLGAAVAMSACTGTAGPGAGPGADDGGPRPILEPAPPSARCDGPPLPALTTRSEMIEDAARLANPRSAYDWAGYADADLGIGRFRVDATDGAEPAGELYTDWPQHVVFPLFDAPDGEHLGWFDRGWIVLGFGEDALHRQGSGAGQVETDYEQQSLIALEATPDGWYRIRHTEPRPDEAGTAWVHACHLRGTPVALTFQSWQDVFAGLGDVPVFFRSEVRHSLRAAPSADSLRVAWIPADPGDSEIYILEIAADWMRVRVERPATRCSAEDDVDVSADEGWIKWRDEEKGPWIWWHTRGC